MYNRGRNSELLVASCKLVAISTYSTSILILCDAIYADRDVNFLFKDCQANSDGFIDISETVKFVTK